MTPSQIESAAQDLLEAERTRTPIPPLSVQFPGMTLDNAYAVQSAIIAAKQSAGLKRIGWKAGLTNKPVQWECGLDHPIFGALFEDVLIPEGSQVATDRFIAPVIEPELAFVMKAPLPGPVTSIGAVLEATDCICPALEIVDARQLPTDPATGQAGNVFDSVAENSRAAGAVLPEDLRFAPDQLDLRRTGVVLSDGDVVLATGLSAGVLGHPALSIVALAGWLDEQGLRIEAGDIVLTGSITRAVAAERGHAYVADYGSAGRLRIGF